MTTGFGGGGGPALAPGTVIASKYRVEQVLAEGGMGIVFTAWHQTLGQRVAIKLLLPSLAQNQEALERFQREARAAAQLRSDHVVRVFDVDVLADGAPYMVMEHLEGESLDQSLGRRGPFAVAEAVDCVVEALSAIAEAHAAGIVHRDLKPANVFLHGLPDGRRVVKVLDFGISKLTESEGLGAQGSGRDITSSQSLLGTPAYMAPEQMVSSRDVDGRGDLWSMGVILYELLTGRMLFEAETAGSTFAKIIHMEIPPLRMLRPDAPRGLEMVVARCLERDPQLRFGTATELMDALFPFASEAVANLRARPHTFVPTGAAAPRAQPTDLTFGRGGRSATSALPVVVPSVIAVALAAVLGWQFLASSPAPLPAPAATSGAGEARAEELPPEEAEVENEELEAASDEEDPPPEASASASASTAPTAAPRPTPWNDNLGLDERK